MQKPINNPTLRGVSLLVALLICSAISLAGYAPRELLVKFREAPVQSSLDGVITTASSAINELVGEERCTVALPYEKFSGLAAQTLKIAHLRLTSDIDTEDLYNSLSSDPCVEWVTRNWRYQLEQHSLDDGYVPNDSLYRDAWWLERILAPFAWQITRGDTSIVIGVIDTGTDLTNGDLIPNFWRNPGEIPENGIDDDNNGFVDDVIGWDFVDAPTLPAGGDYLERDSEPMDDFGHGTYVAGIACGASDNLLCYPSVGFHCRLMTLRAGNSNGTLEEDDIAAALLYGAANGASIINMSFGDVVASPLLQEACHIAGESGVVLVASAGNRNRSSIHYPSGFPEVISVGATDTLDFPASFSNHGPWVDVMAPGTGILSTLLGSSCGAWNFSTQGTSFASPIVAGIAGLMLSVNDELTPDDVRSILISTCDDMRQEGWDSSSVAGRVNALHAVEAAAFGSEAVARIHTPRIDSGVSGSFEVIGEAWGSAFESYSLQYGLGDNPATWISAETGSDRIISGMLGEITAPATDTIMTIRLSVFATTGAYSTDFSHVYVQNDAPRIDSISSRVMLDADGYGLQLRAWTNQVGRATLLMTNATGDSIREDFGYVSDDHVAIVSQERYLGEWEAVIRFSNLRGEFADSDPLEFSNSESGILSYLYARSATGMPYGKPGTFVSDYDCDEFPEIWLLPIDVDDVVDTLEPYEWNGAQFVETENTYGAHLPQCYGDADGDGLMEIGGRRFTETRVWEQSEPCGALNSVIFESLPTWENFLIGDFVTVDSASGRQDIAARVEIGDQLLMALYEVSPSYELMLRDTLPNSSEGQNDYGPPNFECGNFDGDANVDVFFGDYDGDVIWCEWRGAEFVQVATARMPEVDATTRFALEDYDGDGANELIAASRSNAGYSTESERLLLGWDYVLFESPANDEIAATDTIYVLGNENLTSHPSSMTPGDVNADGRAELLVSAYPDFYVIELDEQSGELRATWSYFPSESGAMVVHDFNRNGVNEVLMTDGAGQLLIEATTVTGERPYPPLLSGEPLDETTVSLTWESVPGAEAYQVWRARHGETPQWYVTVDTAGWHETGLAADSIFDYALLTVDEEFPNPLSVLSNIVSLAANHAPSSNDTAQVISHRSLAVSFSERMGPSAFVQGNYRIDDEAMPATILEGEGGRAFYLSFDDDLSVGTHSLGLRNMRDAQGSRLPDGESVVHVIVEPQADELPYIVSHDLLDGPVGTRVRIEFSEDMGSSADSEENYRVVDSRNGAPSHVSRVSSVSIRSVEVELDSRFPAGATGIPVRIQARNLFSLEGAPLDTIGGRADVVIGGTASDLSSVYVYPNPFSGVAASGRAGVVFAALPEKATIRIFSFNGAFLRKIEHDNPTGAEEWNLRTEDGDRVASGVYLYTIESEGETVRGKLAVAK
ncbi:S8 family serine peptidase [bacterium]|nr:S8 family serine peptidase [bacterium]